MAGTGSGFNVGSIFGLFELDDKAFQDALKKAEQKVKSFVKEFVAATAKLSLKGIGTGIGLALKPFEKLRDTIFSLKGLLAGIGISFGIKELIGRANDIEKTAQAYDSLTRSLGILGDVMLQKVKVAVRGSISDMDIMASTNRAILLGVVESEEQWVKLAEAARRLGSAMGRDARDALEDIAIGIGRQSRLILDNLGIIVRAEDAYQKYANALGVGVDNLTEAQRRSAFISAAMAVIQERLTKLGPEARLVSNDWARLGAAMQDTFDTIAVAFRGGAIARTVADWLTTNRNSIAAYSRFLAGYLDNIVNFVLAALRKVWGNTDRIINGIKAALQGAIEVAIRLVGTFFTQVSPVIAQGVIAISKLIWSTLISQKNQLGEALRAIFGTEVSQLKDEIDRLQTEIENSRSILAKDGIPQKVFGGFTESTVTVSLPPERRAEIERTLADMERRREELKAEFSKLQRMSTQETQQRALDLAVADITRETDRTIIMSKQAAQKIIDEVSPVMEGAGRDIVASLGIGMEKAQFVKQLETLHKRLQGDLISPLFQIQQIRLNPIRFEPLQDAINNLIVGAQRAGEALLGNKGIFAPINELAVQALGKGMAFVAMGARELDAATTRAVMAIDKMKLSEEELNAVFAPFRQNLEKFKLDTLTQGLPEGAKNLAEFNEKIKVLLNKADPAQLARIDTFRKLLAEVGGKRDQAEQIAKLNEELTGMENAVSDTGAKLDPMVQKFAELDAKLRLNEVALKAAGDAWTIYSARIDALKNREIQDAIGRWNTELEDAKERLNAVTASPLQTRLDALAKKFREQKEAIDKAGLSADGLKAKYEAMRKVEIDIVFQAQIKDLKDQTDDLRAEVQKLGMDEIDSTMFDLQRKLGKDVTSEQFQLLSPEQQEAIRAEYARQLDFNKYIANWKAWQTITKETSSAFLNGLYDAWSRGERGWKVVSSAFNDIFRNAMSKSIDQVTNYLSGALGSLFANLGAGSGLAGVANGLIAVGGLIYQALDSKTNATVDDFSSAINSSEAVRGVVAGPTNVAISKVGDSFKAALRPTEGYLQRIAEAVERGTGFAGSSYGGSGTLPLNTMPPSTT